MPNKGLFRFFNTKKQREMNEGVIDVGKLRIQLDKQLKQAPEQIKAEMAVENEMKLEEAKLSNLEVFVDESFKKLADRRLAPSVRLSLTQELLSREEWANELRIKTKQLSEKQWSMRMGRVNRTPTADEAKGEVNEVEED